MMIEEKELPADEVEDGAQMSFADLAVQDDLVGMKDYVDVAIRAKLDDFFNSEEDPVEDGDAGE